MYAGYNYQKVICITLLELSRLLFTTTVAVCINTTLLFGVTVLVAVLDVFCGCVCSLSLSLLSLLFFESLLLSLLVCCLELSLSLCSFTDVCLMSSFASKTCSLAFTISLVMPSLCTDVSSQLTMWYVFLVLAFVTILHLSAK